MFGLAQKVTSSSMQTVRIKKGRRFRISGTPDPAVESLADPEQVALLPAKIPHIKPRLQVTEGDQVHIGSPLLEDKRNARIRFLSPAGGTVAQVKFGPRRRVEAIIILRDSHDEPELTFEPIPSGTLDAMDREDIVARILTGGLWWVFHELPFRDYPDPDCAPPRIIVSLSAKEPFQPQPSAYLQDQNDLFEFGLRVLHKLAQGNVVVFGDAGDAYLTSRYGHRLTHTVEGNFPADDAGTLLYHIKVSPNENRSWYINGQDLLLLAGLLAHGRYPIERIVAVGGDAAPVRRHVRTRLGAPLSHVVGTSAIGKDTRLVVGGLMRGYAAGPDGFVGLYETAVSLVTEGARAQFLALFRPGFAAQSYSRVFLSRLNPAQLTYDCNVHGDERACIACMHCADVCPVDILPQMTYKAILAEEVEEFLEHGLLDCVECGLCSYVCPSKIELSQTFKTAKAAYAIEQTGSRKS
jgi:Na+-transporting NADH:ubiquinone oxidoreductase subunit A